MSPFQERVIAERDDLQEKINRLDGFIGESPTYDTLPKAEQARLSLQLDVMGGYLDILNARIGAFK